MLGESADAGGGKIQQLIEFAGRKWPAFRSSLHFDETAPAGHNHVHIYFRAGIFFVAQIEHGIAENQADINRLLLGFGVPLLDEKDRPIADDAQAR